MDGCDGCDGWVPFGYNVYVRPIKMRPDLQLRVAHLWKFDEDQIQHICSNASNKHIHVFFTI